jgi:HPt (histidine-containing phosphotransfer) domain-containing protein
VRDVSDPDLERDLCQLREAYRPKLVEKLAQLDGHLRRAREERLAKQQLEAARQLAHMLMGTSGSYGLDEVSAELARIEEQLEHLLENETPDPAAAWTAIEQALGQARARATGPASGAAP